ncbi:hypothetical protein B5M42_000805 [Paenibacillus athensensis]|uniref:Uncharacterized protein n=1 Tax=Paenibacillus athensensis TaxID=1967502 RepID=A0A4Y8Q722_9BACL|nr:hypothetical protein [Paenibacillus athensensis]MCD1257374.1 hypothetical protein [Paenibacillus athensensis]
MEGELGSGARIAIALIVIGVIISVIFVILGFTRGTTNQGITTVQNSMDSMSLAQFDDYDQKILSGTQVVSAIKLFEGRPVGTITITTSSNFPGAATTPTGKGYNYGAILEGSTETSSGSRIFATDQYAKSGGNSWYEKGFKDTPIKFNMNYLPLTETGKATYVRPTAKFLAELIKDSTGTIVGICFTQQ